MTQRAYAVNAPWIRIFHVVATIALWGGAVLLWARALGLGRNFALALTLTFSAPAALAFTWLAIVESVWMSVALRWVPALRSTQVDDRVFLITVVTALPRSTIAVVADAVEEAVLLLPAASFSNAWGGSVMSTLKIADGDVTKYRHIAAQALAWGPVIQ